MRVEGGQRRLWFYEHKSALTHTHRPQERTSAPGANMGLINKHRNVRIERAGARQGDPRRRRLLAVRRKRRSPFSTCEDPCLQRGLTYNERTAIERFFTLQCVLIIEEFLYVRSQHGFPDNFATVPRSRHDFQISRHDDASELLAVGADASKAFGNAPQGVPDNTLRR